MLLSRSQFSWRVMNLRPQDYELSVLPLCCSLGIHCSIDLCTKIFHKNVSNLPKERAGNITKEKKLAFFCKKLRSNKEECLMKKYLNKRHCTISILAPESETVFVPIGRCYETFYFCNLFLVPAVAAFETLKHWISDVLVNHMCYHCWTYVLFFILFPKYRWQLDFQSSNTG